MRADGFPPGHLQATLFRLIHGFGVEIEEDLHMVGDEADRNDRDGLVSFLFQLLDTITDIGL